MKKLFTLISVFLLIKDGIAQAPTWAQDIAPIFYANCTSCHHKGGSGEPALVTYSSALANADTIDADVMNKSMPPWPPDATYNRLAHERLLSGNDIQKIHDWVVGGALMGDTNTAPTPPIYTNGSALGTPDLSLQIPTYTVPLNQTADIYQCFALATSLPQDMYITAMEIIPGTPSVVHHVLVYQDTTGQCLQLDSNSPGPGYTNFGGVGVPTATLVGGWVPGGQPEYLPPNFGIKLFKNATIVLQIHYPLGGAGKLDSTRVNFKLVDNVGREVTMSAVLNYITNITPYPLSIPANNVKTFTEKQNIGYGSDYSLLTVGPHCHLLGKQWISFGVTPTGDTIPFIKINNWDFRWQGFYPFRKLIYLPKGSTMYAQCTYDNTTNNPTNPNNPTPKTVIAGDATTNEMMLVYFSYLPYQAGDENISQDTSQLVDITDTATSTGNNDLTIVTTPQLYDARPNPANGETMLSYFLPTAGTAEMKIFDINGQLVDEPKATGVYGFNYLTYNASRLNSGTYIFSLTINGVTKSKRLVVAN